MPDHVITFDFHQTIASADAWFHIEIRDLPGAYLRWRYERDGIVPDQALLDEANAAYRRLRQSIHAHGHELSAEQCLDLVLHRIGFDEPSSTIEEGAEAIMRASFRDIAPIPGVVEFVRELRDAGIELGIVSSAVYHPFLLWTLDAFEIHDAFSSVTTSASAGYYKSRPEIYWSALESLDASPEGALHIGDSYRWDVLGAKRAGMQTAWYQRPGAEPLADSDSPDLTLQSYDGATTRLLERLYATT